MQELYAYFFYNSRYSLPGKLLLLLLLFTFIGRTTFGQATLPHTRTAWGGAEPTGWTNFGCTQRTTSSACSGNDATIFDNTGDFRTVFFNGTASQLQFVLKNQSMSGESFLIVEESPNGTAWTSMTPGFTGYGTGLGSIPITNAICSPFTLTPLSATRYIRWTYTKASGNCDMDDVNLTGQPLYYRSVATGDWTTPATWETSTDNTTFTAASTTPSSADLSINIRNTHTVTISTGVSFKATTVESGGILRITTASSYTIADGPGDDLNIESGGKLQLNFGAATAAAISGAGTARVKTGGIVEANSCGSGGSIGNNYVVTTCKFTYEHNSVFDWRIGTTILGNNDYFKTDNSAQIPVFRISVNPGFSYGGAAASTFNAKLECNAALNLQLAGSKTFTGGITGTGSVTQIVGSGPIVLPTAAAVLDGSVTLNVLNNGLQIPVGTTVMTGANVKITGTEDANIDKQSGSLIIDGTLDVAGLQISNSGMAEVRVNGTGTLKTSNLDGFSGTGATIVSGFINLISGSTVELNRADGLTQNFESRTDFKNIKFSGNGIKKPSSGFDPTGTITVTGAAIFDARGYNVGTNLTNLTMDGGRMIVSTTGQQPQIDGTYNLTGGVIEFNGSSNETIKPKNGASSDILYKSIEVTGSDVRMSNANINLAATGSFAVKSGGVFTINDNTITGPTGNQIVTVENGALFKSGNNEGFNGFAATFSNNSSIHQNIETITLQSSSTVEYTRAGDQPITVLGILSYGNLTLSGSGNKTAPVSLIIYGNFLVNTGSTFVHNNGAVVFGGPAIQSYTVPPAGVTFYDISNNNTFGLNVNSDMSVINAFSMGVPNAKLTLNDTVTLLSGPSKTARIGQMLSGAAITYGTGRFNIERYIPVHPKAWQFLAAPIQPGETVNAAWQEGNAPLADNKPGYGTTIVGISPANGFDFVGNAYSIKTYNPANDDWSGIPNTTATDISNPKGYMLFVRGDRSVQTLNGTPTATILRTTGKIYDVATAPPVISVQADKFESAGNPFASAIDLTQLNRSASIQDIYYVWDPKLTTGPNSAWGLGGYRTLTRNGSTYDVTPVGGNYAATTKYIQSGQAFFVHAFAAPGTVTFEENDKVSVSAVVTRRPVTDVIDQRLSTNLFVSANGNEILLDGVLAQFSQQYNNRLDAMDAVKINNTGENLGIRTGNKNLVVERRALIQNNDTIFYNLGQLRMQSYQFKFAPQHMQMNGLTAWLVDRYSNGYTEVSMTDSTTIAFEVTTNPLSAAANRFMLVFRRGSKAGPSIEVAETQSAITIAPNPVTGKQLNIQFANQLPGNYKLQLVNAMGQVVYSTGARISNSLETRVYKVQAPAGIYMLNITDPSGKKTSRQAIIQ